MSEEARLPCGYLVKWDATVKPTDADPPPADVLLCPVLLWLVPPDERKAPNE